MKKIKFDCLFEFKLTVGLQILMRGGGVIQDIKYGRTIKHLV